MKINKTYFSDVYHFDLEPVEDNRGNFTRFFCKKTLRSLGINFKPKQASFATNIEKHTLRGMHFQLHPNSEQKIISCLRGSIWDVVIDIRKNSQNYSKWFAIELSEKKQNVLYVPRGFAHGYLTLTPNTHLIYIMDEYYNSKYSRGINWNDALIDIKWPTLPSKISSRDKNLPSLSEI
jgi:dTDP-4-dehydrorhamnose 3,5-epimerase